MNIKDINIVTRIQNKKNRLFLILRLYCRKTGVKNKIAKNK